jgi:hypothetical protein
MFFFGFRMPLEDIEFDKDKSDQPEERIPEIKKNPVYTPVDCA